MESIRMCVRLGVVSAILAAGASMAAARGDDVQEFVAKQTAAVKMQHDILLVGLGKLKLRIEASKLDPDAKALGLQHIEQDLERCTDKTALPSSDEAAELTTAYVASLDNFRKAIETHRVKYQKSAAKDKSGASLAALDDLDHKLSRIITGSDRLA